MCSQAYIARDGAARVWMAHAFKARLSGPKSYRVPHSSARMGQAERICHAIGLVVYFVFYSLSLLRAMGVNISTVRYVIITGFRLNYTLLIVSRQLDRVIIVYFACVNQMP